MPLLDDFAEPSRPVQLAREAEAAGWDGFFVSDLAESEIAPTEADACIVAAAIAATTASMQLGLVTPAADRRRPWVLARQSAIIDHLSNGRLVFGTGAGHASWHANLLAPAGQGDESDARTSLFEESLAVLLLCWSGEPVRHEGRWMQIDSPPFLPAPLQRPRIPVWVSAEWPRQRPLRRAAHLDGILPVFTESADPWAPPDVEDVRTMREELRQLGAPTHHELALRGVLGPTVAPESFELLRKLENAGATWWLETAMPGESAVSMSERVSAGPPKEH